MTPRWISVLIVQVANEAYVVSRFIRGPLKKWQTNHLRIKSAIWRTIILSSFQFPFQFVIVLVRQSTEQLTQNSNHWVRHWLSHSQHRPGSVRTWCMQKSTQTKLGCFRKIPQYNAWFIQCLIHPFGGWTTEFVLPSTGNSTFDAVWKLSALGI